MIFGIKNSPNEENNNTEEINKKLQEMPEEEIKAIREKIEKNTGLQIVEEKDSIPITTEELEKEDKLKKEKKRKLKFDKLEETKLKKVSPEQQKQQTQKYGTTFFLYQSWIILKRFLRLLEKNPDVTRLSLLCIFSVLFGVFATLLIYKLALSYLAGGIGSLVAIIVTFIKKLATPPGAISRKLQRELRDKRTDPFGRTLFDNSSDED